MFFCERRGAAGWNVVPMPGNLITSVILGSYGLSKSGRYRLEGWLSYRILEEESGDYSTFWLEDRLDCNFFFMLALWQLKKLSLRGVKPINFIKQRVFLGF